MRIEPASLLRIRRTIDHIDDVVLLLLAARTRLARRAERSKRAARLPLSDPAREVQVHARAAALARHIGLPAATARRAMALMIDAAHREQGISPDVDQGGGAVGEPIMAADKTIPDTMTPDTSNPRASEIPHARLLRWLPPPARFAPWLKALPAPMQHRWLERAIARVLAAPLSAGTLDFMQGRRLGIHVSDLGLRWVIEGRDGRLCVGGGDSEACVRGTATDLLLLASRLEDADTLFFQRRLVLTGDTELGLTARNLLERLPWESVPLGLRIALNRGARLARDARDAHRAHA